MPGANRLVYKGKTFDRFRSLRFNQSESISLSALPIDTLKATIVDESQTDRILSSYNMPISSGDMLLSTKLHTDRLDKYSYGDPVNLYHKGSLVERFYVESVKRQSSIDWYMSCVSDIGLLVSSDFYGGVYNGTHVEDLIASIIDGIIPYYIDSAIMGTEMYGWLPKQSRRNSLRDVLFAAGGTLQRLADGTLYITTYKVDNPYQLDAGSFYKDNGSVTDGTPATAAIITEHSFAARTTDTEVLLYSGEVIGEEIITPKGASVFGLVVEFTNPCHDLTVSEGTAILEQDVNYAVLPPTAFVTLTGKEYTHTTHTISRRSTQQGIVPNEVLVKDCFLINSRNSVNIAERVIAFYGHAKRVTVDTVLTTQKPGDLVEFTDPYGDSRLGYIESLDTTASESMKSTATIACNFEPPVQRIQYFHHAFFFASGTFVVPDGVNFVRFVLIGGADGGNSGAPGGSSTAGQSYSVGPHTTSGSYQTYIAGTGPGKGGKGGQASPGASGAKVYSATVKVTPGSSIQIIIGVGGNGGICVGQQAAPGSPGTPSKFGDYSSDQGQPIADGYLEEITHETYATAGDPGVDGADGVSGSLVAVYNPHFGDTGYEASYTDGPGVSYGGVLYRAGLEKGTVEYSSSSTESGSGTSYVERTYYTAKGLGGGASAGTQGGNSTNNAGATSGKPAARAAQTKAGCGGHGGHGGAGAGGPGLKENSLYKHSSGSAKIVAPSAQTLSDGSLGGNGGKGGNGAVFLYWYSFDPEN